MPLRFWRPSVRFEYSAAAAAFRNIPQQCAVLYSFLDVDIEISHKRNEHMRENSGRDLRHICFDFYLEFVGFHGSSLVHPRINFPIKIASFADH